MKSSRQAFLERHINTFFQLFSESNKPLDLLLSQYFRSHKNLGSTDRKIIGDTIYGMVRWKTLIEHFDPVDPISFYQSLDWEKVLKNPSIPLSARLGLPEFLFSRFSESFGLEKTERLGEILNQTAPTTIRINPLKTNREELLKMWGNKFSVAICKESSLGIQFHKREPLFALPEFKQGLFEMQDEGSQILSDLVKPKEGDCVLDYCSGSGGKTLAFAHRMREKGQIYLHDIRLHALQEAKRRLRRAGIQNAQCIPPNHDQMRRLIGKCDWVLADVPCSGTGTLRRNPDQKWKIDAPFVKKLIEQQKQIANEALKYVKTEGRFVYATCSILPEENTEQVNYLLKNHPLQLVQEPISILPQSGGMDGFFGAVFKKVPAK